MSDASSTGKRLKNDVELVDRFGKPIGNGYTVPDARWGSGESGPPSGAIHAFTASLVWANQAMYYTLAAAHLTAELNRKIRNPFSIKRGAGTAESYYHHLPSLLSPELSLQWHHAAFWEEVRAFYREVRNPLFHGQELRTTDPEDILPCMSVIHFMYEWIATWHPLEVTNLRPRYVVLRPKR